MTNCNECHQEGLHAMSCSRGRYKARAKMSDERCRCAYTAETGRVHDCLIDTLQARVKELEGALKQLAKGNRAPGVLRIARAALNTEGSHKP